MSSSTSNALRATVIEAVSGNGRNRCAAVVVAGEVVASYHVRDYGPRYLVKAEEHAARLNAAPAAEVSP